MKEDCTEDLDKKIFETLPLEDAISYDKYPINKINISKSSGKEEQTEKTEKSTNNHPFFSSISLTRCFPYLEVESRTLAEGSVALAEAEEEIKKYKKEDSDVDGLSEFQNAFKSFAKRFVPETPQEMKNMAPGTPIMKTVEVKKVKKKIASWVFPKFNTENPSEEEKSYKSVYQKEMKYMVDNLLPVYEATRISNKNRDVLDTFLNDILFPNFTHSTEQLFIVPFQASSQEPTKEGSLLNFSFNPEKTSFHITLKKADFSVLDGYIYKTDLLLTVKTIYPFFSFFTKFIGLVMSSLFLRQTKLNFKDWR